MIGFEKALLLVASIRAAIKNGAVHKHPVTGKTLATEEAVLTALRDHSAVDVIEPVGIEPITSTEEELAAMRPAPARRSRFSPNLQNVPHRTDAARAIREALSNPPMPSDRAKAAMQRYRETFGKKGGV